MLLGTKLPSVTSQVDEIASPTSIAWYMSLAGLSDDASVPWGLSIFKNLTSPSAPTGFASITIGQSLQTPQSSSNVQVLSSNQNQTNTYDQVLVISEADSAVILGRNASFSTFGTLQNLNATHEQFPTVPFGLNLGKAGAWNGSLFLGLEYDANRVQTSPWQRIGTPPYPVNPLNQNTGTFLNSGKILLGAASVQSYTWNPDLATDGPFAENQPGNSMYWDSVAIDFNSEAILVPESDYLCGQNVSIIIYGDDDSTDVYRFAPWGFPIPAELTLAPERCYDSHANGSTLVLGKPFFQAIFLMVPNIDGDVYAIPAHQLDVPISPAPFQPLDWVNERIPSSPSKTNLGAIIGGTLGGVSGLLVIAALIFCLIKRRSRRTRIGLDCNSASSMASETSSKHDSVDAEAVKSDEPQRRGWKFGLNKKVWDNRRPAYLSRM